MNPHQKISTLQIEVHDSSEFPADLYSIITVHDRESGLDFKAAGTGKKEILRNGRLAQAGSFGVDSDVGEGGSFTLSPREDGSVLLLVKEHLTLLDEVSYEGEVIIPEDAKTLTLSGIDKDNNVFRAMPTPCDD